jgi:hypothetical protein
MYTTELINAVRNPKHVYAARSACDASSLKRPFLENVRVLAFQIAVYDKLVGDMSDLPTTVHGSESVKCLTGLLLNYTTSARMSLS